VKYAVAKTRTNVKLLAFVSTVHNYTTSPHYKTSTNFNLIKTKMALKRVFMKNVRNVSFSKTIFLQGKGKELVLDEILQSFEFNDSLSSADMENNSLPDSFFPAHPGVLMPIQKVQ